MAFSSSEGKLLFEDFLLHMAKPLGFKSFLDVGAGAGIYGQLIRKVMGNDVLIDAVEIFQEYIARHNLNLIYDRIINDDILKVADRLGPYDLITIGDCLEHLPWSHSTELVRILKKKCKFIWAALPVKMKDRDWSVGYSQPDEEFGENPYNKHLHDWTGPEITNNFFPLWLVPFRMTGTFLVEGEIK